MYELFVIPVAPFHNRQQLLNQMLEEALGELNNDE